MLFEYRDFLDVLSLCMEWPCIYLMHICIKPLAFLLTLVLPPLSKALMYHPLPNPTSTHPPPHPTPRTIRNGLFGGIKRMCCADIYTQLQLYFVIAWNSMRLKDPQPPKVTNLDLHIICTEWKCGL